MKSLGPTLAAGLSRLDAVDTLVCARRAPKGSGDGLDGEIVAASAESV